MKKQASTSGKARKKQRAPYSPPVIKDHGRLRDVVKGAWQKFGLDNGEFPWVFTYS